MEFLDQPSNNTFTFTTEDGDEATFTTDEESGEIWGNAEMADGRDFVLEPSPDTARDATLGLKRIVRLSQPKVYYTPEVKKKVPNQPTNPTRIKLHCLEQTEQSEAEGMNTLDTFADSKGAGANFKDPQTQLHF